MAPRIKADDDWFLWAVLVFFGALVLIWLIVNILSILILPLGLVGVVALIFGVYENNEDVSKIGLVLIFAAVISFIIVMLVTQSPLWGPAETTVKSIIDSNIQGVLLPS